MSNIGVIRRVQAMLWLGVTPDSIADKIRSTAEEVTQTAEGVPGLVDQDRVRELYRKILIAPKFRDNEASRVARTRGWNGPGAWDDIDNPEAIPEINIHPLTTPREMMRDIKSRCGWTNKKLSSEFQVSRQVVRETLMGRRNRLYSSRYFDTREAYLRVLKGD